eukprot:TRINITY_DN405_c0_g1_i6.p1 TRINITY_DN405_c0_g1~~TRINITY_DN405_c0_g1_i6.p1  ORF type:complete len:113 (-),score=5.23 TRINITY_DN405_c0_g1_i6:145-483(-)
MGRVKTYTSEVDHGTKSDFRYEYLSERAIASVRHNVLLTTTLQSVVGIADIIAAALWFSTEALLKTLLLCGLIVGVCMIQYGFTFYSRWKTDFIFNQVATVLFFLARGIVST